MKTTKLSGYIGGLTIAVLTVIAIEPAHSDSIINPTATIANGSDPKFPPRPDVALTGSEFLRLTTTMASAAREAAILTEIRTGNVPSHIRKLTPVQVGYQDHQATVYVIPDYLAVGSDDDYVIIPMAPRTAMNIAREFGFTLPTKKLVDDIYNSSTLRLSPEPLRPGPRMRSNEYYQEHDRRIKSQRSRHKSSSVLIAGHKKDVVLTPRLLLLPQRVAIYGWHRQNGRPIQPLSLVHGVEYVDYSHGVRLISRRATVDGREVDLSQVLSDAELNPLFSDEGRVSIQSYL
jgi:hypothetical protein